MGNNPIISIVMPVYNVEPCLSQSIESLLSQDFKSFELICINDASTDNSGIILRKYAAIDKRIRIIEHDNNKGAGGARNEGLELSRGEWIIFLDADDYFSNNLLSKTYSVACEHNADVVYVDYIEYNQQENKIVGPKDKSLTVQRIINGKVFSSSELRDRLFEVLYIVPWNKLCRKSFLREYNLNFQEIPNSNDVYFGSCIAIFAKRIYFLEEPLVIHRVNHANQISASRGKKPICAYRALKLLKDRMVKDDVFDVYKGGFYWLALSAIRYALVAKKTEFKSRLKFRLFMRTQGWKNLGMDNLQESDFFYKDDFIRYVDISNTLDTVFDEQMFSDLKKISGVVYIWGFGLMGRTFYNASKYYSYSISGIIDEDINLRGKKVDGFTILPCFEQKEDFDYVIITNEIYGGSIRRCLDATGHENVRIIDAGAYVKHKVSIMDCIF